MCDLTENSFSYLGLQADPAELFHYTVGLVGSVDKQTRGGSRKQVQVQIRFNSVELC